MKIEIMYGETTRKEKVISIHTFYKNNAICALVNANPLMKIRKRERDKLLYEIQEAVNSCVSAFIK